MRWLLFLIGGAWCGTAWTQPITAFADSVRRAYDVPELGYAVVTSSAVIHLEVMGVKQVGTERRAERTDRFRIGSITKTVTAEVAAEAVRSGALQWDTRFFQLFPELEAGSHKAYRTITLLDLLAFRARFLRWTYTDTVPVPEQFSGDADSQRVQLMQWAVQQDPVRKGKGIHFSNLSYVAAGLMLERATGRSYRELVQAYGTAHGIKFGFGAPNITDSLDTWGQTANGDPEPPAPNVKLEWLLAAGGINLDLPDHATLAQLQLRGMEHMADTLDPAAFARLEHDPDRVFALGWRWAVDADGTVRLYHVGNPGTFLTKVFLHPYADRAYVLYANRQSDGTDAALDALYTELVRLDAAK